MRNPSDTLHTAIHEAGHLIATLKYSPKSVIGVSIKPNEFSFGRLTVESNRIAYQQLEFGSLTPANERHLRVNLIGLVSGPLADCRSRKINDFTKVGAYTDLDHVGNIIFSLYYDQRVAKAYLNYIIEEGRALVYNKQNWTMIKKFAKILIEKEELNKKEIHFHYNEMRNLI